MEQPEINQSSKNYSWSKFVVEMVNMLLLLAVVAKIIALKIAAA